MKTVQVNDHTKHITLSETSWSTVWAEINTINEVAIIHKEGSISNPTLSEQIVLNKAELQKLVSEL